MATSTAAEPIARWKSKSDGDLILNQDGKLWERNTMSLPYKIVMHRASGVDALLYAAKRGYDLVGTVPPSNFTPPAQEVRMSATETRQRGSAQDYYERVNALLESDNPPPTKDAAFEIVAEQLGKAKGSISTSYHRIARQHGEGRPASTRTRTARPTPKVIGVPEELESLLPMVRAGIHAFERIIEWAELRKTQLDEREATLEDREKQAMDAIQERLQELFPGAKK